MLPVNFDYRICSWKEIFVLIKYSLAKLIKLFYSTFSGFKVSVTDELFWDILLDLIPFWSDYLSFRWMLFSDKQMYNQVNLNYMAEKDASITFCEFSEKIVTFYNYYIIFYLPYNRFYLLLFSDYYQPLFSFYL